MATLTAFGGVPIASVNPGLDRRFLASLVARPRGTVRARCPYDRGTHSIRFVPGDEVFAVARVTEPGREPRTRTLVGPAAVAALAQYRLWQTLSN